jgi:putative FmdB family regulatory protein
MVYNFKCSECSFVVEVVQPMATATLEDRNCPRCNKITAKHVFEGAPAVATSGMTHAPIDVAIGRDAEARWADIKRRQGLRNKVRQDSGEQAVQMTGRNEFAPIKGGRLETVAAPNSGEDKD